jgi:hypothetical protein
MHCRCKRLLQNIRLVFDEAQSMNFHSRVAFWDVHVTFDEEELENTY